MARPQKTGLDYFPVDVDIFSDTKIRIVMARFGADGFAFYAYLLAKIYRDGFYVKADEDFLLIASADLQMSSEKIGQMLSFFFERSLLEGKLFKADKILTSTGIQRRYQEAIKSRASKKSVIIDGRYWLLKADETEPFIKVHIHEGFSGINMDKSEKNRSKSENNSTKESKEKESRVKERSETATPSLMQDIVSRYGKPLVDSYIQKAGTYKYTGDKAIDKAAQWLAEDAARGKIKPKKETSFDLDAYTDMVKAYRPKFSKKE